MVGRTVSLFPKVETPVGDVLLEVDGLTRAGVFRDIGFSVRAGEIVGFAGLVGAGRTEVARVLFGIDRRDGGEIRLGGDAGRVREPVRGDGRRDRLPARGPPPGGPRPRLLDRPERDAADPAPPVPAAARPRVGRAEVADDYTEQFNVRMTGVDQLVGALSGGNQQKVVLAKWLASKPTRPHPRRADPRHRHRGEGRGPPDHLGAGRVGARDHPHLERPARGPRDVRPDPRPPRGPDHRRDPADRATEERVMFAATGSVDGGDAGGATTGHAGRRWLSPP